MTALHAVRVAAKLRRELGTEVDMVKGPYGKFKVLVDGKVVIDAGTAAFLGWLPSARKISAAVQASLAP